MTKGPNSLKEKLSVAKEIRHGYDGAKLKASVKSKAIKRAKGDKRDYMGMPDR